MRVAVFVAVAQVGKSEHDTGVKVCQVAQAVGEARVFVDRFGEYFGVGREIYSGAVFRGVAGDSHRAGGFAIGIFLHIHLAIAAHFGAKISRQSVDARHAHTVKTARHFVRTLVELTAGMKHGQNHFERRLMKFFVLINRDTATIVDHHNRIVFGDGNVDTVGISCKSFVDRVIYYLRHQVVKTLHTGVADIHGRAFSYGFKAFEHLNIRGFVFAGLIF